MKLTKIILTVLVSISLFNCKTLDQKYQKEAEKMEYKEKMDALRARGNNMAVLMKKYNREGWESDGVKSVEWALREHQTAVAKPKMKGYKGSSERAITKSQAISIAQTVAHGAYAKDVSSFIDGKAEIDSQLNKNKSGDGEGKFNFSETITQNAVAISGGFLEKSYVFVVRKENAWYAEVAYLYDTNRDLEVYNKVLEKTLKNSKLFAQEKLWLNELKNSLNK